MEDHLKLQGQPLKSSKSVYSSEFEDSPVGMNLSANLGFDTACRDIECTINFSNQNLENPFLTKQYGCLMSSTDRGEFRGISNGWFEVFRASFYKLMLFLVRHLELEP